MFFYGHSRLFGPYPLLLHLSPPNLYTTYLFHHVYLYTFEKEKSPPLHFPSAIGSAGKVCPGRIKGGQYSFREEEGGGEEGRGSSPPGDVFRAGGEARLGGSSLLGDG